MERADTGGMRGFGGSRPASIGVLPRADSVAGSRAGGAGGALNRPGTAKMGENLLAAPKRDDGVPATHTLLAVRICSHQIALDGFALICWHRSGATAASLDHAGRSASNRSDGRSSSGGGSPAAAAFR